MEREEKQGRRKRERDSILLMLTLIPDFYLQYVLFLYFFKMNWVPATQCSMLDVIPSERLG